MNWNTNVNIAFGFMLGIICAAVFIAASQSADSKLDLDTLGKIATVLVVPLTIGLVGFTAVLARETRQMWVQNRQPHVVVTIEPMEGQIQLMEIVVANVGPGPAFDVSATLHPDIERKSAQHPIKVSESSLLRVPVLKPGQRFATFVGEWMNLSPTRTTFTCTCRDATGTQHVFTNDADLSAYKTLLQTGNPPLEEIAKTLEGIRRALSKRIEVNTHDAGDRAMEETENRASFREFLRTRAGDGGQEAGEG